MPTIMALGDSGGRRSRRPRCKKVKGRNGTRRLCPVEKTENGKWKWQFERNPRRKRR